MTSLFLKKEKLFIGRLHKYRIEMFSYLLVVVVVVAPCGLSIPICLKEACETEGGNASHNNQLQFINCMMKKQHLVLMW